MRITRTATLLALALPIALVLGSCDGDPTGTSGEGSIRGWVSVFDNPSYSYEDVRRDDHSGATVEILGTSHSMVTGRDGQWSFDGIAPGHYEIEVRKEGYTTQRAELNYIGSGTLRYDDFLLYPMPDFSVTSFDARFVGGDTIRVTFSVDGDPPSDVLLTVGIAYSFEGQSGDLRRRSQWFGSVSATEQEGTKTVDLRLSGIRFLREVSPGTRVRVHAFPATRRPSTYYDYDLRTLIFASWSVEGSMVTTAVVP